jgi:hypothetical protein
MSSGVPDEEFTGAEIPVVGGLADFVGCVGGEVAEQAEHLWRILLTEHAGNTVLATGPDDAKWKEFSAG